MGEGQDLLGPFSSLLHELYRASHEMPCEQFQEAALALLKPVFAFDTSMWGAGTVNGGAVAVHSIHVHRQPAEFIENWQEVSHQDSIVAEVTAKPGHAMRAHSATLLSGPQKRGIRAFTQRYDVENALVVCTPQRELGLLNWISLYRKHTDDQFSFREKKLLEFFWPHLVQALTINRVVNLDRLYLSGESKRACLAIADRKGVVYHHERAFESVVCQEWPDWRPPQLPPPVVEAMLAPVGAYRSGRIAIDFSRAADLFFLNARVLSRLDRLPPRAREIAKHFSRGFSHKEIARHLGIAPATVRNHLQDVYRKLEVSDKAQLATLFASAE